MATIEDFRKIELKVACIKEAAFHPDADKLLVLKVDVGGQERQIVAGIRRAYDPATLPGKKIVIVANLEPAVIRGVESQGMLLAASDENGLSLLVPEKDILSGSQVR